VSKVQNSERIDKLQKWRFIFVSLINGLA